MTTQNSFYSWNTRKTANGFEALVTKLTPRTTLNEVGNYCDSELMKAATLPTRARAKAYAQKLMRYYKATATN
jgi:hypothetical protein